MQTKRTRQVRGGRARVFALVAAAAAAVSLAIGGINAIAANPTPPATSKTLTDNGDGTYDLTLSVTGAASSSTTKKKANVILVMDTSGSMGFHAQSATGRYGSNNGGKDVFTLYYKRGNNYYELKNDDYVGTVYYYNNWRATVYSGDRFSAQTRLDVAKAASTSLVQTLAANNASATDDTVEIALVSFAGNANPASADGVSWSKGNSMASLESQIGRMSATGGTNWDDGLHVAKAAADAKKASQPDEQTYVIFVSDGDPTYYMNDSHTDRFGNGSSVTDSCYNAAAAEATAINNAGYGFYAVGAFGNVTRMESLATAGGGEYYSAADTAALNNAFAEIVTSITNSASFQDVVITDGVTAATAATVLGEHATAGDYAYAIAGPDGSRHTLVLNEDGTIKTVDGGAAPVTLTDIAGNTLTLQPGAAFPAATKADDGVKWDLSALGTLLNGYTYSVSFKVWPSQQAYDTVAKLNDGLVSWDDVDQTMFTRTEQADGSYAYALVTNTSAKVDYKAVQTVNGEVVSTIHGSSTFGDQPSIALTSTTMGAKKEWVGEHSNDPIEFALYVDGRDSGGRVTLTADNNWQGSIHIAPGLKVNGEVLEEGHDYQLIEVTPHPDYEFTSVVAHPMLIDSATAITDPAGHAVTLTAKNVRKSTLDITKAVNNVTGGANAQTPFSFDVTVNDADDAVTDVTYQVVAADGTVGPDQTMKNGSTQEIKLRAGEKIHFPALSTGSTYTVTEKDLPAGYSVDEATKTGTIAEGNQSYKAAFTNTYAAAPVTASFPVRKVLATSDGLAAPDITGAYTFTLTAADGAPLPDVTEATNPAADGGTVTFGDITYTAPGTYTYTVTESGQVAGVSNDSTASKNVTVTVTDDGTGQLAAAASSTDDAPLTFTNTYSVGEVQATVSVEKDLEVASGDNAPDVAGAYTFTLRDAGGAEVGTVKSGASGATVDFAPITYTKPGTYTYTVTEAGQVDGVTNDATASKNVTVVVTDNSDGTMSAVVNDGNGAVVFTNTYAVEQTSIEIPVRKALEVASGNNAPDVAGAYTFALSDADGNEVGTVESGASGETVNFAKVTYDKPGTYTYTVTESGQLAGVTNDPAAATGKAVTVTVTDNGDGTMIATCSSTENAPLTFTNTYEAAPATASIVARKVVTADEGLAAPDVTGKFTFTLAAVDGAPMPDATTATNPDADGGAVTFGDITYTAPGTYTYKVTESGDVAGFTNDAEATTGKTVTVTVTDDGQGNLVAVSSATADDPVTFTNNYAVTEATAQVWAQKVLEVATGDNAPDVAGAFTFALADADGEVATAVCGESGVPVLLAEPTFAKPGTYTYTVTETGQLAGVTNDAEAATGKTVTVTVTDNGNGTLSAVSSAPAETPVTFTNTYAAAPVTASFPVRKVLATTDGLAAPDIAGAYTFTLTAADGVPLPAVTTATNPDADGGTVTFGDMTYTEPGTYTYTVTESGQVAGVSNDSTSSKNVTVTVTDDGKGQLHATASSTDDAPLTFTNTYSVGEVQATVSVEKDLEVASGDNAPDVAGAYTFTLRDAGGAEVGTVKSGASGATVDFAPITYTKPGTYTYAITESGQLAGVTNDAEATTGKTVTVVVTDNSDGTMSAVVNGGNGAVVFTNTYAVSEAEAEIRVEKALESTNGDNLPDTTGKFTFTLRDADGDEVGTVESGASGEAVAFAPITYDKPGTYTYTVTESGQLAGVTNDPAAATGKAVTVTVTDNGDGTMAAVASTDAAPVTFTNTYEPAAATALIPVRKVVTADEGLDAPDVTGRFTFALAAVDGAPMPDVATVTNPDADGGTATFGQITYDKPGTYEYTVTESGNVAGFTNDRSAEVGKTVTVTVTDNGDGTMTADCSSTTLNPVTFTNNYGVEQTSVEIPVRKVLEVASGDNAPDVTGAFTFTLADADGNEVGTVESGASGKTVSFAKVDFTKPGTYTYTVTETGQLAGVTNDPEATTGKTVTVTVTDNGDGTMAATCDSTEDDPVTFTNTYSVGETKVATADFHLAKVLEGRDWKDSDSFEFTLTAVDGAPLPAATTATVTKPADGTTAPFDFGEITYDASGTYEYEVREAQGSIGGVKYDDHVATISVTVTDNGQGQLVAGTAVVNGGTFTNTYSTEDVTYDTVDLGFAKEFTGRAWAGDEFSFRLAAADGTPMPANDTATVAGPDEDGGTTAAFNFGTITYDAPGTYTYTVTEEAGTNAGITYDSHVATVTVTVTDDGEGHLLAEAAVEGDTTFTNSYAATPATATIAAAKTLTNRPQVAGEFSFAVTDANGDTVATATNGADGSVSFSPIEYTSEGLAAAVASGAATRTSTDNADVYTFQYTVAEDTSALPGGVTAVTSSFQVQVRVTDDRAGNLTAEVLYPESGLTFENAYGAGAEAQVNLNGAKVLEVASGDNAPDITGAYTFAIAGSDGAPTPERTSVTNDAAGNVDFGKVTFKMDELFADAASAERTKTFTYTVTESGSVPGVTNDPQVKTIIVTVTDNGDGTLAATAEGNAFTFANTYSVEPATSSVTDSIGVCKDLTGRALAPGEFEFTLSDAHGNVVDTATNDADGAVTFAPLTFDAPGSYGFTIGEKRGELGGVTYDATTHAVTATVTDNGDGTLSVTWASAADADADGITFRNAYAYAPTTVSLTAKKVLDGRKLADGEFEFTLSQDGTVVQKVANAADGTVAFAPVTFDAPGEYDLAIAEVKGSAAGVTYDGTIFKAHVSVVDDGQGHLVATTTQDAAPVFHNRYEVKVTTTTTVTTVTTPPTGDAGTAAGLVALVAAAFVTCGFALRYRRVR